MSIEQMIIVGAHEAGKEIMRNACINIGKGKKFRIVPNAQINEDYFVEWYEYMVSFD